MKKWIAAAVAAAMSVTMLAGCGAKNGGSKVADEDMNTCPKDAYEINWYLMVDPQNDVHSVEEKMNEYLKDKLNVTVKLNCLSSAQYSQKLGTMINANEYFDLCFAARWMLDYVGNSRAGAFFKLDDYLDTYLKGIADEYGRENLEYAKIDGGLYALPVYKEMVTQYGWIYRKDIADKYGIDMNKYKSFEELEPVLKMIKENEPDIKYPIDWATDMTPASKFGQENYIVESFLFRDGTKDAGKSVNPYSTEGYLKACQTARDFYNKGYVRPDVLTATDQLQRMKEGKTFVMMQPVKPGKAKELFKNTAYDFDQTEITEPTLDYLAGTGSMQAISASSKNPVRVMRFLNLLNTDRYLKNLVVHGIEGKHYERIDDKTVKAIPGSGYDLYSNSWAIGNVFLDDLLDTEDPNKLTDLKAYNDRAKTSKLDNAILSFCLKEDDERTRVRSEINGVIDKYTKQIVTGAVDPEPVIKEMNEQFKKVGIDDYIKSIQDEFDEYYKAQQ